MNTQQLNKKLIALIHNKAFEQAIKSEIALGCRVEVYAYNDDEGGYIDWIINVNSDGSFELRQGGCVIYNPDVISYDVLERPMRYEILGLPITLPRLVIAMNNFLNTASQDQQSNYYGYDNGLVLFSEADEICIFANDGYSQGVQMIKDWRLVNDSGIEATLDDQTQTLKEALIAIVNGL